MRSRQHALFDLWCPFSICWNHPVYGVATLSAPGSMGMILLSLKSDTDPKSQLITTDHIDPSPTWKGCLPDLQSLVIGFQSMAQQWRIEIQIGHKEALNFKFKRWEPEFLSSDDENQYWQAPTRPKRRIKGGIFPDGHFPGHFSPLRWAIGRSKVQNLGVWTNQISGTPQIASAPKLNWILLRSCPPIYPPCTRWQVQASAFNTSCRPSR
jgi:hypothetical protein